MFGHLSALNQVCLCQLILSILSFAQHWISQSVCCGPQHWSSNNTYNFSNNFYNPLNIICNLYPYISRSIHSAVAGDRYPDIKITAGRRFQFGYGPNINLQAESLLVGIGDIVQIRRTIFLNLPL